MMSKSGTRNWHSLLKADPTNWLLEEDNPSVRYFTLVDLLGKSESDPEVVRARRQIMETPPVSRILQTQKEGGYWGNPDKFYVGGKWKGSFFTLMLLAEFGASAEDECVKKACEFLFEHSQVKESGGFAQASGADGHGRASKVHPCMTGKMVWSMIRLGYANDARTQHGIEWITKYQRLDDGDTQPPPDFPYTSPSCWGRHSCFRGVMWGLKALAEVPVEKRSAEVKRTMAAATEYILRHHVYKRSHNPEQVMKEEWSQFIFPMVGDNDVLDIVLALTKAGVRDARMQSAIDLVRSKQDARGMWTLERTWETRAAIGEVGQPNKWATLRAMSALKRLGT